MLERSEWVTVGLLVVFVLTLIVTVQFGGVATWLGWGVVMVILAGGALIAFNRREPPQ